MRTPFTGDVFRCFALYLAPVLNVFVCVFLYWVRPLVMLLTFAACALGLGYIRLGAPFGRLTRPSRRSLRASEREVLKKQFPTGFFGCSPFGRLTRPSRRSFGGGEATSVLGGGDRCKILSQKMCLTREKLPFTPTFPLKRPIGEIKNFFKRITHNYFPLEKAFLFGLLNVRLGSLRWTKLIFFLRIKMWVTFFMFITFTSYISFCSVSWWQFFKLCSRYSAFCWN